MKREILNQKNYTIENLEQLKKAVNEILLFFSDKELILLSGDLGTGKTQSIQFFFRVNGRIKGEFAQLRHSQSIHIKNGFSRPC